MKAFFHLLANTIIASVTNMTVWFAIIFYIFLQTKSVFATSIMSGLFLVATALTGFWFGSVIDHNKKKVVMLVASFFSLTTYIIGFFIYTTAPANSFNHIDSPILWIFVPILLLGVVVGNIRGIALPTIITLLVPSKNRDKANGLAGTANGISFLITSVISGFLVGRAGMQWVLILAIVLTVATIVDLLTILLPEKNVVHKEESGKKLDLKKTLAVIVGIPGLLALIFFTMFNNFLGGVFMSLMDAYGLSLVSVEVWGVIWGVLSSAFIIGGILIAKFGLGKNPLRSMFIANIIIWSISSVFTVYPSVVPLMIGMFIYLSVVPFIQAAEFTIIQKVVPHERQGRVFGFAQSIEQAASPLTAFAIGPITQFIFIPFMTTGEGARVLGPFFGVGPARGIALVFTIAGIIGLTTTLLAMKSKYYGLLSRRYLQGN